MSVCSCICTCLSDEPVKHLPVCLCVCLTYPSGLPFWTYPSVYLYTCLDQSFSFQVSNPLLFKVYRISYLLLLPQKKKF